MSGCTCNYSLGNTGKPGCVSLAKAFKGFIIAPYYDSTGTINSISIAGATIAGSVITALINQTDTSKRWYPFPPLKNFSSTRAASDKKTWDDGSTTKLNPGIRSVSAIVPKESFAFLNKLHSYECEDLGVWLIDYDNNLVGMQGATGLMYGIRISKGSWDTTLQFAQQTKEVQSILIGFDFDPSEEDENLIMVLASEITGGLNLGNIMGLIDVNAAISGISATGFTMTLTGDYGTKLVPNKITGMITANFTLYNNTDSAAVTITSVTETATPGVYTVVMPSQTSADSLTVSGTKTGYDFSRINDTPFLIP